MREFTVSEILEYSRNIEKESYSFYKDAAAKFDDDELKKVVTDLAEEELKHYNRITALLEKSPVSGSDLDKRIKINDDDYDHLVSTREIPEKPTPLSILETAYEREVRTESVYRTLISFTDLDEEIVKVFTDLVAQEKGHAGRVKAVMGRYK